MAPPTVSCLVLTCGHPCSGKSAAAADLARALTAAGVESKIIDEQLLGLGAMRTNPAAAQPWVGLGLGGVPLLSTWPNPRVHDLTINDRSFVRGPTRGGSIPTEFCLDAALESIPRDSWAPTESWPTEAFLCTP